MVIGANVWAKCLGWGRTLGGGKQDAVNMVGMSHKRSVVQQARIWAMKKVFPWIRGMTLGARVAVVDGQGRFLLVKHTYSTPWIFPGGGVERGETCLDAALREIEEEAAVVATGPLQLHGIFSNEADFRGDHLAFYVCREFERKVFTPNREIAAAEFFAVEALPAIVSAGSRRRIDELVSGRTPSDIW